MKKKKGNGHDLKELAENTQRHYSELGLNMRMLRSDMEAHRKTLDDRFEKMEMNISNMKKDSEGILNYLAWVDEDLQKHKTNKDVHTLPR